MRLGVRWRTPRTKIIAWSFATTAIILVAVALVAFIVYQRVTEGLVIERGQALTRLSANQLATELGEYADTLAALTRTADVHGPPAARRIALRRASDRLAAFDGGVLVLDTFGTVVAAEPERPDVLGQDWSGRPYFHQMRRAPGVVFSDVMADGPGGAEVIVVAVPILGDQGEFLGAVVGMLRLDATATTSFYGDVVKPRLGESSSAYLVDGDGRVITHSDPDRIGEDFSAQAGVQQVLKGQVGALRTRDLEGRDVLVSFAPVPGTPWGLVSEESWAALIGPGGGYRQFLLLLLVLGVVTPALVVAAGVGWITKPVAGLLGAARSVAEEDSGRTITAQPGDEVAELAEQFDLVSAQLQASYAHLEQKVAARTHELSTLLEVSRNVAATLELEPLLGLILDQLKSVVDYVGASILGLDEGYLKVLAYRGPIPHEEALGLRFPVEKAVANREVIQRRESVIIPDVRGDTPLAQAFQEMAGDQLETTFGYVRCWMGVPLIVKDRVVGMLSLDHNEPDCYTPQQGKLVLAFAAQVAVAMENARLYAETRRRADEIQTLFNVQQAIASPLEWEAVLQLIADEARRLTATRFSAVFLLDGDALRLAVFSGDPIPGFSVGYRMPIDQSVAGSSLQSGQSIPVTDVENDPRVNLAANQVTGAQSFLVVPLLTDSQRIGVILVADKSAEALGADDERVLTMLASGAVIQLENARLYQEEQAQRRDAERRRQVAEGLRGILAVLNSNRPLDEILDFIVAQAVRLLGTDAGAIYRLQDEGGLLSVQAYHGLDDDYVTMTVPVGKGTTGQAVLERRPMAVPDTKVYLANLANVHRAAPEPGLRKLLARAAHRFGAVLSVPLMVKDQVYGAITLYYHKPRAFSDEEIELAVTFADQAALAIENARLRARAEQSAVVAERNRLARDLHDAVTQTLFSASLIAEVLPRLWERNPEEGRRRLKELRELTRGALAEMRTLLLELRPAAFVDADLGDLLRQLAESITGRARVPVAVEVEGERPFPPEVKVALYRIAQEALNNVARHAGASRARVSLRSRPEGVKLCIRDDGCGFDPEGISPDSLGLGIMKERAETIGATLRIESQVDQGTQVTVIWPLDEGGKTDG